MASTHYQIMQGIQDVIQALTLTGVTGGNPLPDSQVYLKTVARNINVTLPCVIVSLVPNGQEDMAGELNNSDDIGYPTMVTIVFADNADNPSTDLSDFLEWREQIREAFHQKAPAALDTVVTPPLLYCEWEPAAIFDLNTWKEQNLFLSGGVVRTYTREARS